MLTAIVLFVIGLTGWALGRARPQFNAVMCIFAVFGAVTAHSGLQWAFVDGRLHNALGDPREGGAAFMVLFIAAGEALGLWVPLLFIPWAQAGARLWGAMYALFAATAAAVMFYFPDDLVALASFFPTDGPPYLLFAFLCVPVAAIGYSAGWMRARDDDVDRDMRLPLE